MKNASSPTLAMVNGEKPATASQPVKLDMRYLIRALIKYNASDLHIKAGRPPLYRINGNVVALKMADITPEQAEAIIFQMLSEKQIRDLERDRQINLSFAISDLGRFRCNVYYQLGTVAAAIRMIPLVVPNLDEIGVPPVIKSLCERPRGLLLVTGASGVGKSTTLAAMIQYLNENHHLHILAIEDPIEFAFRDLKASITQREVGIDTLSLQDGLLAGLRQDPDVIVIGELLNRQMIETALTAAETGHLVLSTLHTNNAKSTISRIFDVFPPDAQHQVRIQLASTLIGVISQQLLPRADGTGRIPACEVMVKSPMIEEFIRKNEIDRIVDAMAGSNNHYKMQTMNQALHHLVKSGMVTMDEALKASDSPADLKLVLSGLVREEGFDMAKQASNSPSSTAKIELER